MSDVADVNAVLKSKACGSCGAQGLTEYAVIESKRYCWLCTWAELGILI
jgi:Na+-translocating ferredoxin:NAD+ oxidoreductase RNF subunit RnfB